MHLSYFQPTFSVNAIYKSAVLTSDFVPSSSSYLVSFYAKLYCGNIESVQSICRRHQMTNITLRPHALNEGENTL